MAAKRTKKRKKAKGRKRAAKKPARKKAKSRAKKRPARKKAKAKKKAKRRPAKKRKPAKKKAKRKPAKKKAKKKKAKRRAKKKVGGKVDVSEARIVLDDASVARAKRIQERTVREFKGVPNAARRISNEAEELSAQALEAISVGKLKRAIDLAVRVSGLLAAIPRLAPRSAIARSLATGRFSVAPLTGAIRRLSGLVDRAAPGALGGVMLLGDLGAPA